TGVDFLVSPLGAPDMVRGRALMVPVRISRLGHAALNVRDIDASVKSYTERLGFQVSDVNERGIVFLRLPAHGDHPTMNLVQAERGAGGGSSPLNHRALQVGSLAHLRMRKPR